MRLSLRPYQIEALERIAEAEARGSMRQLGVAATGLGKTVVFCALAERRQQRTLILAHRDELIEQAAAKVAEVWPEARVGVVKAERNELSADVVVSSVPTLARARRLAQLPTHRWAAIGGSLFGFGEPFGLVVIDEAHHSAAETYRRVIDHLGVGEPGGPLMLGVTATPDRGDGKGLDDLFDEITFAYDLLWGIRSGYLCDLRGMRIQLDKLDMGSVKVSRGDYQAGDTGRALEEANAPELIVQAWRQHAVGRRTLVFTPTVETAVHVVDAFRAWDVRAGMVSGETPIHERRATLAAFSRGEIEVLANCAVLTEGYDEPRTDCVIVARPTKSRALYTQMVGRGTRRHPDKADCLVLDVVGATADHSLVTIPSLFGLGNPERVWEGETITAAVAAEEADAVAAGILRAEEVELFAQMRATIAWVATHRDGELRRYVCHLGRQGDTVELTQQEIGEDCYTAKVIPWHDHKSPDPAPPPRLLLDRVALEMAQGVGEDYARKYGVGAMVDPNAEWRSKPPTMKALAAAKKWRLPNLRNYQTAGELSDALTAHIERRKRKKAG